MPVSENRMLQGIYDALFGAFTDPPPGAAGEGGSDAARTFLALNWPGSQVDPAQFANPAGPANPNGNWGAVETLSVLVDRIPSVNPIFSPTGNTVSQIYEQVLGATVTPPPPDPKAEKDYETARALLFTAQTDVDDAGKPVEVVVESPLYANYKRKNREYQAAVQTLLAEYFRFDMSKPADQRQWALLGPTHQDAVREAFDAREAAGHAKVRDALAVLGQSAENQVGQLFASAASQFAAMRRASVVNPGSSYLSSWAQPANWFTPAAAADWTTMTIKSGSEHTVARSDYLKGSVGAKAAFGLWSVGPDFDAEKSHESNDTATDELTISFKFARVEISRPWFNGLLFEVGGWRTPLFPAGGLSDGTKDQAGSPFPLLPTSFIAVRDLRISASWGTKDTSLITGRLGGSMSLGYGPFAISGNYAHGSTDKSFASSFDGTTITNDGLQIIGWISTVVPRSPRETAGSTVAPATVPAGR